MKITTINKTTSAVPKTFIRIEFSEDERAKYIERNDGTMSLVVGAGKYRDITARKFRILCRTIVRAARTHKIERIAIETHTSFPQLYERGEAWIIATMTENFIIANYEYTAYKKEEYDFKEILICGKQNAETKRAFDRAVIVATEVNICRDIANTPGGAMTPSILAEQAKKIVAGTKVTVTVFDKKRIEKEKMGALLGVGQGAKHGPRFIILEYWGVGKPHKSVKSGGARGADKHDPIVFVGKGITFDSGGLNVKVGDAMLDMHLDMSGGAAVIAAVACAAKLKLKQNIIGLIPATENAISDDSLRPGDILTTRSGKTVDVLNTDAEGRLILADALTYAQVYKPRLVVDVATLTGASLVALGEHASALMTKDDTVRAKLMALAEESGDYLWPLPLWDEYKQYTKGRFGDIANIPVSGTRWGGVINGGMFLSHFTENYPKGCGWAHIDMAPRMTSVPSDKLAKGAVGEPVRLLVAIAEKY